MPPAEVIPRGIAETWQMTTEMIAGLRELFGGILAGQGGLQDIAGPLGMGQITSEFVDRNPLPVWVTLAQLSILLSLNLGVLNLLPLPALDGGRLMFVLAEVLRGGRRVAPEREGLVHLAGFVLLIGFMAVVLLSDAIRIFSGQSFLP